ncbi:MAG: nucleotidyltransferase domain-containing protein [Candidatus Bathyarchaeota archaeon]|nr:nucleotidyltransferase domain-containing protein [Candidatus Bathyarchaeota archaeon]
MSHDLLVEAALQRQEVFNNLAKYLQIIKKTVRRLDSQAGTYLFGSTAEKKNNYSSDTDILIVTNLKPARIHAELWKAGIKEPFEIHVHTQDEAEFFRNRAKLKKI